MTTIEELVRQHQEQVARLKANLLETIQDALKQAKWYGPENSMGNYSSSGPQAFTVEVVEGALMVEWTDGESSERFAIEVEQA